MLAGTGEGQDVSRSSFDQVLQGLGHEAAEAGFSQDDHTQAAPMAFKGKHGVRSDRPMANRPGKADDSTAMVWATDQQLGDMATDGAASHPLEAAIHFVMASLWQALPQAVREAAKEGGAGPSGEGQGHHALQQLMATMTNPSNRSSADKPQQLMASLSNDLLLPDGRPWRHLLENRPHPRDDRLAQDMVSTLPDIRPQSLSLTDGRPWRHLLENRPQPRDDRLAQGTAHAAALQDEAIQAGDALRGPSSLWSMPRTMPQDVAPQAGQAGAGQGLTASETEAPFADLTLAASPMIEDAKALSSQSTSLRWGAAAMAVLPDAMQDLRDLGLRLLAPLQEMAAASWNNHPAITLPWEGTMSAATLPIPIQHAAWLAGPQGGIEGLQLQTNLAQLGDVVIRIDMQDGLRRIQLVADNLASAHALSLSVSTLEHQLAQAGLQDVRVHVNLNSHSPFASLGQHDAAHQHHSPQDSHHAPDTGRPVLPEPTLLAEDQKGWQGILAGPHVVNYLA